MKNIKYIVAILLGVIAPVLILAQSYVSVGETTKMLDANTDVSDVISQFKKIDSMTSPNDYRLLSLMLVEAGNIKTIVNKQIMKTTVVNIGFAVISVGLALMLLGIRESLSSSKDQDTARQESHDLAIGVAGVTFDIKTGSTGVIVIVIGAAMATIGGVLPNQYKGSGLPYYTAENENISETMLEATKYLGLSHAAYKKCLKESNSAICFKEKFEKINKDYLK